MTSSGAQLSVAVGRKVTVTAIYVTGLQMRRAADLHLGTAKTDPIDAWALADFARRNLNRLVWLGVGDELLIRLRVLNGWDTDLGTNTNRTVNRYSDAVVGVSPALERVLGGQLHQPGIRDALTMWSTTTELKSVGKTKIRNRIKKRSPRLANKLADEICEALAAQTVVLPAEATWGEVVTALVGDLERLHTQRAGLAATIDEPFMSHPLREVGNPNRFQTGARLAAYAGLAPTDRRSGRSLNASSKTRGGNHRLKNTMFIAAFVATRHEPHAKAYYQRKRDKGKKHNAAVICVARRRCDLILAMLKNARPYEPDIHQHTPIAA